MNDADLRPPRRRVDPRAPMYWRCVVLLYAAAPAVVAAVVAWFVASWATTLWLVVVVIGAVGIAAAALLPAWWYRVHRWEVTDVAVYTHTGWFWQEARLAPMSRIQTVDTTRNPLEQRFGLATLVVTTASSAGAVTIEGLDHRLAADLAHQLGAATEEMAGDAT